MKIWLCTGEKNGLPKCIYSKVDIIERYGQWGEKKQELTVFCGKKNKYIHLMVLFCPDYQNTTLENIGNEEK